MDASETTGKAHPTVALQGVKVRLLSRQVAVTVSTTLSSTCVRQVQRRAARQQSICLLQVYVSLGLSHRAAKVERCRRLLPGLGAQLLEVSSPVRVAFRLNLSSTCLLNLSTVTSMLTYPSDPAGAKLSCHAHYRMRRAFQARHEPDERGLSCSSRMARKVPGSSEKSSRKRLC